ncbi:hypothetical protein J3D46_004937 [Paenarthrobacter sp. A20]|nr:hypothetical protein [Paenarthrobacter sp. A20]
MADLAGRYFDIIIGQPYLARLTSWEGLEYGKPVDPDRRALRSAETVAGLCRALPGIGRPVAEELLLTIVTLCHAWISNPNVSAIVTPEISQARRRTSITRTAELLALDALGISEPTEWPA